MKNILIIKTGAAGDVLRTTFVLDTLSKVFNVYWLTDKLCVPLINSSLANVVTDISELKGIEFDTIYSLEEDVTLLSQMQTLTYTKLIGCYINEGIVTYSAPNEIWFDISLVSKFGVKAADKAKYNNTLTFQEMISGIFDIPFNSEPYNELEYDITDSPYKADIAIAPTAGNKWPNKNWLYYDELIELLKQDGYSINILPQRDSIKQHIADIAAHKLVICGDSLPMHIATALKIPSVALFTCTSPIEIYDYNLITKIVSNQLSKYYYQRELDTNCSTGITVTEVYTAIKNTLLTC
jgi:ADP-heptose:LPS heptosyltransferase